MKHPVQSKRSRERTPAKANAECERERRENASVLLADVQAVGKTCLFSLCQWWRFRNKTGLVAVWSVNTVTTGDVVLKKDGKRDRTVWAIRIFQLVLVATSILCVLSVN